MSECVVRMEMPGKCECCPLERELFEWEDGGEPWVCGHHCSLAYPGYTDKIRSTGRLDNCPILCQLPEGHGRLVDADALPEFDKGGDYTAFHFIEAIENAPTIVPAERSET